MFESSDREQTPQHTPGGGMPFGAEPGGPARPSLSAVTGDAGADSSPLSLAQVEAFLVAAGRVDHGLDDTTRVDQIAALERVKGAVAAAQAHLTADLHTSLTMSTPSGPGMTAWSGPMEAA